METEEKSEFADGGELFHGDTGSLSLPARRALVQLLNGPYVDQRQHAGLWDGLLSHQSAIESRLADLFLELILDRDAGVAFTRQATNEELELPKLLRHVTLQFIDSVLILHLREQLAMALARGERCVISRADMLSYLHPYKRLEDTNEAGYNKRCESAIGRMVSRSLLRKIRSSDDRYEVVATLKILFSPEMVAELTEQYRKILNGEMVKGTDDEEGTDEDGA